MENLTKVNRFILLFLFIFLVLGSLFIFRIWQEKKLANQILEEFEFEKPREEAEKMKISDETMKDWQVFQENYIGYEIKHPSQWKVETIHSSSELPPDAIQYKLSTISFSSPQKEENLMIAINDGEEKKKIEYMNGGYGWEYQWCLQKGKEIIIDKDVKIFSTLATPPAEGGGRISPLSKEKCEAVVSQQNLHRVIADLCLDKNFNQKSYFSSCHYEEEGDFYFIFILECRGKNYLGREGLGKCEQLFNQIVSTFKFSKK
ncbi:MAG: hypothetical protein ABIK76_04460 [candidate division WOR-3 bacterium]